MINNSEVKLPSKSDKDVFLAKLLRNADFDTGFYQIPAIKNCLIEKPKDTVLWVPCVACVLWVV